MQPPFKKHHCQIQNIGMSSVNLNPYSDTELLISILDFNDKLFPNLSYEMCLERLSVLKIQQYLGNRYVFAKIQFTVLFMNGDFLIIELHPFFFLSSDQVQVMGVNPKMPFIRVRDVIQHYPQLSYMAQAQDQPQAKRSRMS